MLIQCTKKLLNEMRLSKPDIIRLDPLFSWHAHIITINHRKVMVMVNDSNRFIVVMYGLNKKLLQKPDVFVEQAIRETFLAECIDEGVIDEYLKCAGPVSFTSSAGRSEIARLNHAIDTVCFYSGLICKEQHIQPGLSLRASRYTVGVSRNPSASFKPIHKLYQDLELLCGRPVFNCKAIVIRAELELDDYKVWRRLVVPAHLTYDTLHQVLQIVFGWQDYHLHEFYIYGEQGKPDMSMIYHSSFHKEGYKPIINLVSDEESLEYAGAIEAKTDIGIRIIDHPFQHVKYNYDYGDNWQHYITLEEIINEYNDNVPVCLAGEGDTPPEDVGGEIGFAELLRILADDSHPDYEDYLKWYKSSSYKPFDLNAINRLLRRRFG